MTFSRAELGKGGMGLDPNDATMGPIMDSLIMTSKIEPHRNSSIQNSYQEFIAKVDKVT